MKVDVLSLELEALEKFVISLGEKKFRAKQIFEWLHKKNVISFSEMTNLSEQLRNQLEEKAYITIMKRAEKQSSQEDGTVKYLFELYDGQLIETVLMRYEHGNSVCISTQAGCRMGCTFCASGMLGLSRQLSSGEMLSQIYHIEKDIGERVSNVVMMGTGEPLDNYDNATTFIRLITNKMGKDLSQRHLTLSTCGLVPKILQLAEEEYQITLAISLHASDDEVRKKTMPIANKYDINSLLSACEVYFEKTGRRVSFEYALIQGLNDSVEEAMALVELLKERSFKCHVNLIPINQVTESTYVKSDKSGVYRFKDTLISHHIETTIRRSLGKDIEAACGQLRLHKSKERLKS